MLSTDAAGLAVKVAKGWIKITSHIDVMHAEKETVQGLLTTPVAEVSLPPAQLRMRRALRKNLNLTATTQ